jgi:hypothetical protein
MKILTISTTAVALVAGLTLANAQHAPTNTTNPSPNSINKGTLPTNPSGSESKPVANGAPAKIIGKSKFCTQSSSGALDCKFASMSACQKTGMHGNLHCVANPALGTVGKKP